MKQFQFQPSSVGSSEGSSKLSQSYLKPSQKGCASIVTQLGFNSLIKGHQRTQLHLSQKTLNERDIFIKQTDQFSDYIKNMSDLLYLLKYRISEQQLFSPKNQLFISMTLQKAQIGVAQVFRKLVQYEQIEAKAFLTQFIASRNSDIKEYTNIQKICQQSQIFVNITEKNKILKTQTKNIIKSLEKQLIISHNIKLFLVKLMQNLSYDIYCKNKKQYKRSYNEVELLMHTIVFMLFNFSKEQFAQTSKLQSIKSCQYLQLLSKNKCLRLIMKFLDDIPDDILATTIKEIVKINRSFV